MDTNIEARDIAGRAVGKLIELRASQSPSLADAATIASEVRVPSGSENSSANKARAEGWIAIRKVCRTLESNPTAKGLDALWGNAIDVTKIWQQSLNG